MGDRLEEFPLPPPETERDPFIDRFRTKASELGLRSQNREDGIVIGDYSYSWANPLALTDEEIVGCSQLITDSFDDCDLIDVLDGSEDVAVIMVRNQQQEIVGVSSIMRLSHALSFAPNEVGPVMHIDYSSVQDSEKGKGIGRGLTEVRIQKALPALLKPGEHSGTILTVVENPNWVEGIVRSIESPKHLQKVVQPTQVDAIEPSVVVGIIDRDANYGFKDKVGADRFVYAYATSIGSDGKPLRTISRWQVVGDDARTVLKKITQTLTKSGQEGELPTTGVYSYQRNLPPNTITPPDLEIVFGNEIVDFTHVDDPEEQVKAEIAKDGKTKIIKGLD